MAYPIQQSTSQAVLMFFLVQSSDHITGLTGATPTVTISKNGGAFGSPSGAVSEISSGWYKVAGNATDVGTLGPLALHAVTTSADPFDNIVAYVVAYNPQDSVHLGLTSLPNTPVTTNASLLTSGTGTDQLEVSSGQVFIASGGVVTASIAAGSIVTGSFFTGAITSGVLNASAENAIADALLARNIAGGSSSGRIVSQALYVLRNKWSVNTASGVYSVYMTDDVTLAWTASLTTNAAAIPIVGDAPST